MELSIIFTKKVQNGRGIKGQSSYRQMVINNYTSSPNFGKSHLYVASGKKGEDLGGRLRISEIRSNGVLE